MHKIKTSVVAFLLFCNIMLSIITNNTAKQHLNSWLTDVQLCRAGFNKARGKRQTKRQRERKRRKKERGQEMDRESSRGRDIAIVCIIFLIRIIWIQDTSESDVDQ